MNGGYPARGRRSRLMSVLGIIAFAVTLKFFADWAGLDDWVPDTPVASGLILVMGILLFGGGGMLMLLRPDTSSRRWALFDRLVGVIGILFGALCVAILVARILPE